MKMKKTLFLAGLFLLLVAAVVTAQSSNETSESAPASTVTQRAVFQVENLTCGACFSKINSALGPLEGFSGMGANLFRKRVAVDFKTPLTPEEIGTAITDIGYPATLDSVESLTENQTFAYMQSKRNGSGFGRGGCCGGGSQGGGGLPSATPSNTSKDI